MLIQFTNLDIYIIVRDYKCAGNNAQSVSSDDESGGTMSTTKALEFGGPTGNAPKSVGYGIKKNLGDGQQ